MNDADESKSELLQQIIGRLVLWRGNPQQPFQTDCVARVGQYSPASCITPSCVARHDHVADIGVAQGVAFDQAAQA